MGTGTIQSMFGFSKCRGFITLEAGARPKRISRTTNPAVPYHEGMKLSFPATLFLSVASASAQQSSMQVPKSSTDEVQNYSLEANSFIEALLKLSARFQFPLGVEWVKSADTLSKVNIWVATFPSVADPNPSGFLQPTGAQNNNGPFWTMLRWGDPPLENMVR